MSKWDIFAWSDIKRCSPAGPFTHSQEEGGKKYKTGNVCAPCGPQSAVYKEHAFTTFINVCAKRYDLMLLTTS